MASPYRDIILELLAELGAIADPAVVEAWMRLEHGTLDHLTRDVLKFEVTVAVECIGLDRALRNAPPETVS